MMLNDEQRKVVESIDPFIFLLAGAGSGKTRVIVERIKRLIENGVDPNEILAITFTRKASLEMKERLSGVNVSIHTFHQLAYITLKEKRKMNFELVDEKTTKIYRDEELLLISNYKNSMFKHKKPKVYDAYQKALLNQNMMDFDDLLIELLRVLKEDPNLISYAYICVDEFQDTNLLQYTLLKKITLKKTNIFAVGDPDQSIYQFRGATPQIIDQYIREYKAKVYQLKLNYRSDQSIIHAANRLIKHNNRLFKKELIPTKPHQGLIKCFQFNTDLYEANFMIKAIQTFQNVSIPLHEIAILYRNHYRAYQITLALHEHAIPFYLSNDQDEQKHKVQLMTLHQAKGLEFDVVMIVGCENELMPSTRINLKSYTEEERRLMFVGMTRSRHILYLTHIRHDSEKHHFTSSIFIRESGLKSTHEKRISDIISLGDYDGHKKTH